MIYAPEESPLEPLDRGARGVFQSDLYNLALERDTARKRNLLYLVLIALCILATLYVTVTARFRTYVVRVDSSTGRIELAGKLEAAPYEPREAEVRHFLAQVVTRMRTLPLDPVLYRRELETAGHFFTPEAARKADSLFPAAERAAKLGRATASVTVKSVQKEPGVENTWQVRWQEELFHAGGSPAGVKEDYVALFSVTVIPQTKEAELLINPLGLFIRDLAVSREKAGGHE